MPIYTETPGQLVDRILYLSDQQVTDTLETLAPEIQLSICQYATSRSQQYQRIADLCYSSFQARQIGVVPVGIQQPPITNFIIINPITNNTTIYNTQEPVEHVVGYLELGFIIFEYANRLELLDSSMVVIRTIDLPEHYVLSRFDNILLVVNEAQQAFLYFDGHYVTVDDENDQLQLIDGIGIYHNNIILLIDEKLYSLPLENEFFTVFEAWLTGNIEETIIAEQVGRFITGRYLQVLVIFYNDESIEVRGINNGRFNTFFTNIPDYEFSIIISQGFQAQVPLESIVLAIAVGTDSIGYVKIDEIVVVIAGQVNSLPIARFEIENVALVSDTYHTYVFINGETLIVFDGYSFKRYIGIEFEGLTAIGDDILIRGHIQEEDFTVINL